MRDLRRVQGDSSALERRLDDALEEEREMRRAFEADRRMRAKEEQQRQAFLREQSLLREEQDNERTSERFERDVDEGNLGPVDLSLIHI